MPIGLKLGCTETERKVKICDEQLNSKLFKNWMIGLKATIVCGGSQIGGFCLVVETSYVVQTTTK